MRQTAEISGGQWMAGRWRHGVSLVLPTATLVLLATGPHGWPGGVLALVVVASTIALDLATGAAAVHPTGRTARREGTPARPRTLPAEAADDDAASRLFDAFLYLMAAMQLVTVALLGRTVSQAGWFEAIATIYLVGNNSGWSGIVIAHELIHRRGRVPRLLGRVVLCTVGYEHFFTEHLRGHHARVGRPTDSATARFGETYEAFFRRTVPAQFASAVQLENERVGLARLGLGGRRVLRHRVVQGVAGGVLVGVALGLAFGPLAVLAHLAQAVVAVRLLEAVNYFEHWGLVRHHGPVRPVDSWDAESAFTTYSLVGLARHADHHAHAARPWTHLRHHPDSPKLPYGYFVMVAYAQALNARFQRRMAAELRDLRLGPFSRDDVDAPTREGRASSVESLVLAEVQAGRGQAGR